MSEHVEIEVIVIAQTDKAFMVHNLKDEKVWIPKSQISDYCGEEHDPSSIFIPQWLATEKELI